MGLSLKFINTEPMNTPYISIIIPVYNVEDFIEACLNSVINQTYKDNFECILIDDCGNDNSMEIAKKIISNYHGNIEFKIISHCKNSGLSAARNTGIKNAKGTYILFLDSDDELTKTSLELLAKPLKEEKYDVVVGSYELIGQGQFEILKIDNDIKILNQEEIFKKFISRKIYEMAWNKLIKRDFLIDNKIWFEDGLLHEDVLWSFYLFYYCHKLKLLIAPTYWYRVRENGIIGQRNAKNILHLKRIFDDKLKFIKQKILYKHYPELTEYMYRQKLALLKGCIVYNIEKSVFKDVQQQKLLLGNHHISIKTIPYLIASNMPYKLFSVIIKIFSPK